MRDKPTHLIFFPSSRPFNNPTSIPAGKGTRFPPTLSSVFLIDGVNAGGIEGRSSAPADVPGTTDDALASWLSSARRSSSASALGVLPFCFAFGVAALESF